MKNNIIPKVEFQQGSMTDNNPRCEQFYKIPCTPKTWDDVAQALNNAFDPDEPYTAEMVKEMPQSLHIHRDGVILLVL